MSRYSEQCVLPMRADLLSLTFEDKASMSVSPTYDELAETSLDCARQCLADTLCQAFALTRNIAPTVPGAGGVRCRRYHQLSATVYDDAAVTYFTGNNTLPVP